MTEPVKIAIVVEGGIIQAICSAGIAVEAVIVDWEIDPAEATQFIAASQSGGAQPANIYREPVEADGAFVMEAFSQLAATVPSDAEEEDY